MNTGAWRVTMVDVSSPVPDPVAGRAPAEATPVDRVAADTMPAGRVPAEAAPVDGAPAEHVPAERVPLRRHRSGRMVAGVCGGIAEHLGVPVLWVRAGFTVLAALSGAGVLAYGLCWMFIKQEPPDRVRVVSGRERTQALGMAAVGLGVAIAASAAGDQLVGWVAGPLGVAAVGVALVWREADETRRRRWAAAGRHGVVGGGRAAVVRVVTGSLFVAGGLLVFLLGRLDLGQLRFALVAVVATLVGVAVLTVPFWVRLSQELTEERRERIRDAERAEIAAHLHDSVLQTLALIQRQADKPREVRRLARGQERELRTWLYGPTGYGQVGSPGTPVARTLAEAITSAAAEVEDTYAVAVRPVVVGDCELDDERAALVQASREAMVNAAKHAQVGEVSVYAEVEPDSVHVFVRDRGVGFDPDEVPADRHGLVDSVHGRMERHGGSASLRSAPGEGTEVHLEMPRTPATDRAGERGPAPAGERGLERTGERGLERAGERGLERAGERGLERAGERGLERAGRDDQVPAGTSNAEGRE
jgi:signal transduction histidine kinase/phage shock protein PspC (stress-responsive transcriptional regulator)